MVSIGSPCWKSVHPAAGWKFFSELLPWLELISSCRYQNTKQVYFYSVRDSFMPLFDMTKKKTAQLYYSHLKGMILFSRWQSFFCIGWVGFSLRSHLQLCGVCFILRIPGIFFLLFPAWKDFSKKKPDTPEPLIPPPPPKQRSQIQKIRSEVAFLNLNLEYFSVYILNKKYGCD